jgi:mannose-6-phosphate isomerase-like protein (cupin superfamily)
MSTLRTRRRASREPWSGDLSVKPRTFALYVGRAGDTEPHAMHVHQLFILLKGRMRIHLWDEGRFPLRGEIRLKEEKVVVLTPGRPLLVPSDQPLQLEGSGDVAIFFLNPEVADGEDSTPSHHLRCALTVLLPGAVSEIVTGLKKCLDGRCNRGEILLLCSQMVGLISALGVRESLYWLVKRTLKCLFEAFEGGGVGGIRALCECIAESGTPPNEFLIQREFRKHVGVAIRRFSIALRLWDAVEEMAYGRSLDDVTAAVDFAKGMLSRYFKRFVGICPSDFYDRGSVQVLT